MTYTIMRKKPGRSLWTVWGTTNSFAAAAFVLAKLRRTRTDWQWELLKEGRGKPVGWQKEGF